MSSFYEHRPLKRKKTVKLRSLVALLGSARVKAARRTLVKLISELTEFRNMKFVKAETVKT